MSTAVTIECVLRRPKGTRVVFGDTEYHFKPRDDTEAHTCEVPDKNHQAMLLGIPEAYREYVPGKPLPQKTLYVPPKPDDIDRWNNEQLVAYAEARGIHWRTKADVARYVDKHFGVGINDKVLAIEMVRALAKIERDYKRRQKQPEAEIEVDMATPPNEPVEERPAPPPMPERERIQPPPGKLEELTKDQLFAWAKDVVCLEDPSNKHLIAQKVMALFDINIEARRPAHEMIRLMAKYAADAQRQ